MRDVRILKGIDAFMAVCSAGSFTVAAERLSLTPSAVGKAIGRLEGRLGTRLFDRTTRRLHMTDAGVAFERVCARVLDELASAERALLTGTDAPAGTLRLDVPATFGRLRVMPMVNDYSRQNPALQTHVSFTDRFVDILEEGIDLAVRIGGPDTWPGALAHRHLGTEQLIFCASPAYLESVTPPRGLQALLQLEAVCYGRPHGPVPSWLLSSPEGPPQRIAVRSRLVVGEAQSQCDAVLAGLGVGQMATWLVQPHLDAGRLVSVLREQVVDGLPLRLVWPRHKQLYPKVDRLLRHLTEHLSIR